LQNGLCDPLEARELHDDLGELRLVESIALQRQGRAYIGFERGVGSLLHIPIIAYSPLIPRQIPLVPVALRSPRTRARLTPWNRNREAL
jgi:hypothetical protein